MGGSPWRLSGPPLESMSGPFAEGLRNGLQRGPGELTRRTSQGNRPNLPAKRAPEEPIVTVHPSKCPGNSLAGPPGPSTVLSLCTPCYAIVLPDQKSAFRAGIWPDCYRERTEIGPPAGRRPAGRPISVASLRVPAPPNPPACKPAAGRSIFLGAMFRKFVDRPRPRPVDF